MKLIGLTGGIGMGKSTSAKLLAERGIPVADTDRIAREVVEPGQPAWEEIKRQFGAEFIRPDGLLNRAAMARKVFADPAARKQLEAIVHPEIRRRWLAETSQWQRQGQAFGIVVIPLMFETAAEKEFHLIICTACRAETQWRRLAERGWPSDQIAQRIAAQWPVERKMARSDFIVWTEGTLPSHREQLDRIINRMVA